MLEVCTGCRLHFGLMELAAGQPHRFAGLGLMIQSPQVRVRVGPKQAIDAFRSTDEELQARVRTTLEHAKQVLEHPMREDWTVAAAEHPRLHSGLGLGTQLGAAVAAAAQLASLASRAAADRSPAELQVNESQVAESQSTGSQWLSVAASARLTDGITASASAGDAFDSRAPCPAEQVRALARLSGRGKRSAVGLHGFLFGGLVQDFGQSPDATESLALSSSQAAGERTFGTRSCAFPSTWPVVLILSSEGGDMCGAVEEQLMIQAGAAPNRERATMLELSDACMSAAATGDFQPFAAALERYMDIAATLFASVQAGRYRNERLAQRVRRAQQAGLRGVGQSSWGPTVFGFAQSDASAQQAASALQVQLEKEPVHVLVTRAANEGARWRPVTPGVQHAS